MTQTSREAGLLKRSALEKRRLVIRINRIEGQVRGLKRLVLSDLHCDAILTQVIASQMALIALGVSILKQHWSYLPPDHEPGGTSVMTDWVSRLLLITQDAEGRMKND